MKTVQIISFLIFQTYIIHIVDSKHVWVNIVDIKLAGHTTHLRVSITSD